MSDAPNESQADGGRLRRACSPELADIIERCEKAAEEFRIHAKNERGWNGRASIRCSDAAAAFLVIASMARQCQANSSISGDSAALSPDTNRK